VSVGQNERVRGHFFGTERVAVEVSNPEIPIKLLLGKFYLRLGR
jgi:hypothetical protein